MAIAVTIKEKTYDANTHKKQGGLLFFYKRRTLIAMISVNKISKSKDPHGRAFEFFNPVCFSFLHGRTNKNTTKELHHAQNTTIA